MNAICLVLTSGNGMQWQHSLHSDVNHTSGFPIKVLFPIFSLDKWGRLALLYDCPMSSLQVPESFPLLKQLLTASVFLYWFENSAVKYSLCPNAHLHSVGLVNFPPFQPKVLFKSFIQQHYSYIQLHHLCRVCLLKRKRKEGFRGGCFLI